MTNSLKKIFICCILLFVSDTALAAGPDYYSTPASVQLTTVQNASNPSQVINISNVGEKGSTLSGKCIETTDPDNVFTITSSTWNHTPGDLPVPIKVSCNSSQAIGMYTGSMDCTHNGNGVTESSPVSYALSCDITPPSEPAYSSIASPRPLVLKAVQVNDPPPSGTLTITNTGDSGTTLTGNCRISGDPQFYIPNAAFSLSQNANQDVTINCNTSTQGIYSGTVSCSHNGANTASPVTYDITCMVGQADYSSTPTSIYLLLLNP